MEFNWEEFKASNNIVVHCKTEEEAIDFCKQMHEHGMEWNNGESYLDKTNWQSYAERTCYTRYGTYANLEHFTKNNYTILEWSDYEKENSMNLELNNLTEEQKKQIIELAKKFEQENEVDKLDYDKDYKVFSYDGGVKQLRKTDGRTTEDLFALGLTAHTKEEAEKIRRRLLVEKELRDWAKKCKESVDWTNKEKAKYCMQYDNDIGKAELCSFFNYTTANIIFTDKEVGKQAIESIGQGRLIRDYFGIERGELTDAN